MILILIALTLSLVGICTSTICEKKCIYNRKLEFIYSAMVVVGVGLTLIFGIVLGITHVGIATYIKDNEIERQSLIDRYFITASIEDDNTERISVSDVMKDIAKYNKEVERYHYWQKNPWTSWLFSEKVSKALKTIHVETFGDGSDECPYQTAIVMDKEGE